MNDTRVYTNEQHRLGDSRDDHGEESVLRLRRWIE
jgi:hypothetical protein